MLEGSATTHEFVQWIARKPRTYADTLEAWRSTCPRLTVWEDALASGLICVDHGGSGRIDSAPVRLTPYGQAVLDMRQKDDA